VSGPIPPAERLQVVDVLRGVAIFGILLVNMELFGTPIYLAGQAFRLWPGWADRAADWLIRFAAEGKFYTMFSFLFGFGLAVQMERTAARGARFVPLYVRRLLVLWLIGAAHALLLWIGDILVTYAMLGFVLLWFRHRRLRTVLATAGACLLLAVLINAGPAALALSGDRLAAAADAPGSADAATELLAQQATRAYTQGDLAEIVRQRVRDLRFLYSYEVFLVFSVLAMFLLGLYAGRRGVFHDVPGHRRLIRRALWWGGGIGLAGNVAFAVAATRGGALADLIHALGFEIGAPALSLAYMAALTLLIERAHWRARLAPLAAVGRTALSNYLLQSLICTTIFYGYGLGWFGRVGPAAGGALAIAIYALQVPLSVWWLRHFRFGPVEWLWRSLTYLRVQPMRIRVAA
jgi:uncharacterized protein